MYEGRGNSGSRLSVHGEGLILVNGSWLRVHGWEEGKGERFWGYSILNLYFLIIALFTYIFMVE